MVKWKEVTDEKREKILRPNQKVEVCNRFSRSDVAISKTNLIRLTENVKIPCSWNEEVIHAKQELNLHQKNYKQINTVRSKNRLEEEELHFDKVKDKAQEEWTDKLLPLFESESTYTERLDHYIKLTDEET